MNRLERRSCLKLIAALAWPTVIEQVLTTAVSYVDTAMVGSLGKNASAAVGATMTVNWMLNGSVMALGVGFLAFIARNIGAGRPEQARKAAAQSVTMAVLSGLLITAFALPLAKYVPRWMRAEQDIRQDAARYFFILYTPMVFRSAIMLFGTVLRASGNTRKPMIVNTATNLINMTLNFFLIYDTRVISVLGLNVTVYGAGLGVTGAAAASAAAFVCGGIWMTAALYNSKTVSPRGMSLKPDPGILVPCFKVALPSCLQRFATSTGYVMFSSMINTLGTVSTAAHSIANTAESAFYIPGWGMQTAASTLIGNAYGEGSNKKLSDLAKMLLILEFIVMTVSGAALFFGAEKLMGLFTNDEDVIRAGARVLRMVAVSEPVYGVAIIIEGIFNGVGNTFHTFLFNTGAMWGVRILGTYIFVCRLGFGLTAAWACMIAHNMTLGLMLSIKYIRGRWRPKISEAAEQTP